MNKAELVAAVAEATGMTKQGAGEAVDATFATITGALSKGDEVKIPGFGGFAVTHTKARSGRNPLTGATIQVPLFVEEGDVVRVDRREDKYLTRVSG